MRVHSMSTGKKKGRKESSAFRGVHWAKASNKWRAQIGHKGKMKYLGTFDDEEAAARAHDEARKKIQLHEEAAARAYDEARKKIQLSKPSRVASASSTRCKNCSKPATPSNYGFCQEHRRLRPGQAAPKKKQLSKPSRVASASSICCKKYSKPAVRSNYGFCQEHRQLRPGQAAPGADQDKGKSTPRSGVDAPADFTCCKSIDSGKENSRRQQYSPTSKQDKKHLHNFYARAKCHAIFLDIALSGTIPDRYKILQACGPFITPS